MPAPRIPRTTARSNPKPNLRSRVAHLAFVRLLPCVACGKAAPSDAAHVRTGTDGGTGMKPGDRYAVPLCSAYGCGLYRPMSRLENALSFAHANGSIWRKHIPSL